MKLLLPNGSEWEVYVLYNSLLIHCYKLNIFKVRKVNSLLKLIEMDSLMAFTCALASSGWLRKRMRKVHFSSSCMALVGAFAEDDMGAFRKGNLLTGKPMVGAVK